MKFGAAAGLLVFVLALAAVPACGGGNVVTPADFAVTYNWAEASVPPPFHYEYTIIIGPGVQGQMTLIPDYPSDTTPTYTAAFQTDKKAVDGLYSLMVWKGVFNRTWRQMADPPVGGPTENMTVIAGGKTYEVPDLAEGGDALAPVFEAINRIVPEEVQSELRTKQAEQFPN